MGEHQNHHFYDLGNFECAIEPQNRSDSSLETPGWTINSKKIPKPFLGKWFLQFTQQCRASGVLESLGEAGAEQNDHPYNKLLKSLDMRKYHRSDLDSTSISHRIYLRLTYLNP